MKKDLATQKQELEVLRSEVVALSDVAEPTEEQQASLAEMVARFNVDEAAYSKEVERAENIDAIRSAAIRDPKLVERAFSAPEVMVKKNPFDDLDSIRFSAPDDGDLISRAVTAFSDTKYGVGVTDAARGEVVRMIEEVPGAAHYSLIHGRPDYMSAFRSWARSGGRPAYTAAEADAVRQAEILRTAMSLTAGNGGYSLPTLLDPTLIHTGTATKNPIRRISRVETGTVNVWHGVTVSNATVYWKGEGSAFTDGSPTTGGPSVTAALLSAYVIGSYEIFEDSSLLNQLPGVIGESFDYKESTAFINGSGSDAPKGIVTAISGTAGSTVTATTRSAFTTASAVDVFALVNSTTPRYEDSSTWVANKKTFNIVRQMSTGSQGSLFWTDLNGSTPPSLLGSPIVSSSDMLTTQTTGSIHIVLGDFSQFLIYDRLGTQVEFVQNVVDGSGIPTGQRALLAHKRVGSDVTDVNAFRFLLL